MGLYQNSFLELKKLLEPIILRVLSMDTPLGFCGGEEEDEEVVYDRYDQAMDISLELMSKVIEHTQQSDVLEELYILLGTPF